MSDGNLRVEICGGIASGKTTLARLLADDEGGALVLEDFRRNPFWQRFYQRPDLYAKEKNLCFLAQHTGEIKAVQAAIVFCDYAVVQDLAYAQLTRDVEHVFVMRQVYEHLYHALPAPRLVVHLRCDAAVQLQRIRDRGRREEDPITIDYLRDLNEALDACLVEHPPCRVLVLRSDTIDFAHDIEKAIAVKQSLLAEIGD